MNMHMMQSKGAQAEGRYLMHVRNNAVTGSTNEAVFGCVQDTMIGIYLMTHEHMMMPAEVLMDITMLQRYARRELSEIMPPCAPDTLVPSRWAIDLLFPRDFHYEQGGVKIVDGRIQPGSGPFNKRHAGTGSSSINFLMALDYSNETSLEWLSDVGRTAFLFLTQYYGFSISLSDMTIDPQTLARAQTQILAACDEAGKQREEKAQLEVLSEAMQVASDAVDQSDFARPLNSLRVLVESGAKGSRLNAQQLIVSVGQQIIGTGRPPLDGNGRTLSCYPPHAAARDAEARGFIPESYVTGLRPKGHFVHAEAARKGLTDTVRFVLFRCPAVVCMWLRRASFFLVSTAAAAAAAA
jgi:hypothetical protein